MRRVKVITDSSADVPKELREGRGVEVVPARIIIDGQSYLDDGTLSTEELLESARKSGKLPKTAAPSEYQLQEAFQKWLGEDYDIFFIAESAKVEETVKNALAAASKLAGGRISIVDSMNVSSGLGLQVLEAADMADSGAGLEEITENAFKIRGKVRTGIVLDTLKYLHIGGRCSRLTSILGDTLNVKPTIDVADGELVPGENLRGRNYIDQFLEKVMVHPELIDPKRIIVAQCLESKIEEVKTRLKRDFDFQNIIVAETSPAISVHCGPGTLGVIYRYR